MASGRNSPSVQEYTLDLDVVSGKSAGDVFTGTIILHLHKPTHVAAIVVVLSGIEMCEWRKQQQENSKQAIFQEERQYVYKPIPAFVMEKGTYSYEFAIAFDETLQAAQSFSMGYGFQRKYILRGYLQKKLNEEPWKKNPVKLNSFLPPPKPVSAMNRIVEEIGKGGKQIAKSAAASTIGSQAPPEKKSIKETQKQKEWQRLSEPIPESRNCETPTIFIPLKPKFLPSFVEANNKPLTVVAEKSFWLGGNISVSLTTATGCFRSGDTIKIFFKASNMTKFDLNSVVAQFQCQAKAFNGKTKRFHFGSPIEFNVHIPPNDARFATELTLKIPYVSDDAKKIRHHCIVEEDCNYLLSSKGTIFDIYYGVCLIIGIPSSIDFDWEVGPLLFYLLPPDKEED